MWKYWTSVEPRTFTIVCHINFYNTVYAPDLNERWKNKFVFRFYSVSRKHLPKIYPYKKQM